MEYSVDLFIKEEYIIALGLTEILVHWGNEWFSQDPQQFSFNEELIFKKKEDINFFKKSYALFMNNAEITDNYIGFRLLGEHELIKDLEWAVNKEKSELIDNKLLNFFRKVYALPDFIVFFVKNGDEIDKHISVDNEKEMVNAICDRLDLKNTLGGVLITKSVK
ncbi:hypothetical protein [Enterococcus sp. LJL51]|uniref:hypothetical protein n=1 Tax=Enterococcus sp. LJL51 TaxID=3416656 RepID=UPI003CF08E1C